MPRALARNSSCVREHDFIGSYVADLGNVINRKQIRTGKAVALGGIKVCTRNGWFAARPSGTEAQDNIYAESFRSERHLGRLVDAAQAMVDESLACAASASAFAAWKPRTTPDRPL